MTITATVADPLETGADVLIWHCTNLGDGCLEEGSDHAWVESLVDGQATATTTVPAALGAFASDEPFRGLSAWALACEPGLCPQMDDPTVYDLADPTSWLADLPIHGVSLAFLPLAVSTRTERVENPVLTPDFDVPTAVAGGESFDLHFLVGLSVVAGPDTLAFGYATGGGFEKTEYTVGDDGEVTLTWIAPDEAGDIDIFVEVNDGAGGVGVWTGSVVW